MVSISIFKSSSTQHDVHLVNYGPIYLKIDHKAGYALGRGYLLIDRSLPQGSVVLKVSAKSWLPVKYVFRQFFVSQNEH